MQLGWKTTMCLAFQSLGIVYGDIGTSPLYVFASTFTNGINNIDDILGVLSLIIYTIVLIPMLKYVFIVLWANDNGNGGAFALYSLFCRHVNVSLIPNQLTEDKVLSNYTTETLSNKLKHKLENSHFARILLLLVTIIGTSMVIGDGILTPSISVLSAVSGVSKSLGQDAVVGITLAILIILFSIQRFGTDKVGFLFAPIILVWFLLTGGIGIYNLFKYDTGVLHAFNPKHIIDYFKRNGKQGWISLGGVFLCITGSEAMFADMGHFSVQAIQISFSFITFPAILAAYSGQAAYLRKFPGKVSNTFYESIPGSLYWPTFVVSVVAAIIASQAMISGAFSIISQALSLGCFPRVKVVHTSTKHGGQVYIPEVNYMFMIACIIVSATFKTTEKISRAYGIAVVCDMIVTTSLVSLIMFVIWKRNIWLVCLFFLPLGCIELLYLSSQLTKFVGGGFLPLVFAMFLTVIMGIWHYVLKERYMFELNNQFSMDYLRELTNNQNINRVPGIGLVYCELVRGIPPIFPHLIANMSSIHSLVVFVSIKAIPVSKVALEERFLFSRVEPKEFRVFRCAVRYGYNDVLDDHIEFENQLVQNLKDFIRQGNFKLEVRTTIATEQVPNSLATSETEMSSSYSNYQSCEVDVVESMEGVVTDEIEFVEKAMKEGVVYLLGEAEVVAESKSSFLNKIVVNFVYSFLRKNFRGEDELMAIPHKRLLKIGITYEI